MRGRQLDITERKYTNIILSTSRISVHEVSVSRKAQRLLRIGCAITILTTRDQTHDILTSYKYGFRGQKCQMVLKRTLLLKTDIDPDI